MSTTNYKLPVIDPASTLSVPDSVNALATATDNVLHGEELEIKSKSKYVLPAATKTSLGGVRVGSGFKAYNNGLLTLEKPPYVLPAASTNMLGGVKTGSNITNTDGSIVVGSGAFNSASVTTAKLKDGGVGTNDILAGTLASGKIDSTALGYLENCYGAWNAATFIKVWILPAGSTTLSFFSYPAILVYTINKHIKFLYIRLCGGNCAASTTYNLYTDGNTYAINDGGADRGFGYAIGQAATNIVGGELGSCAYRVGTFWPRAASSGYLSGEYHHLMGVLDLAAATFTTGSDYDTVSVHNVGGIPILSTIVSLM